MEISRVFWVIPLEVKYRDLKKLEIRRSFRGFLEGYHPERGYIINKSLNHEALVGETRVQSLPYWELIFEEAFPFIANTPTASTPMA